ncbi:hypothetical protein R1flu_020140 [Riccia fluitans]|uniref:Uncharacterized protein n=1 Tax=Riccia fluitans TaxID=41844 RepID=A0ABD1ZLU0_9MARC
MDKRVWFACQETKHVEEAKNRPIEALNGEVETLWIDQTRWTEEWTALRTEHNLLDLPENPSARDSIKHVLKKIHSSSDQASKTEQTMQE